MSISASLLPEFDQEMANTRTALERVPTDRFSWKPHEKSFSFMELVNHLVQIPVWGVATMKSDSLDLDPERSEFAPPQPSETIEGALAAFDAGVAEFREALAAAGNEAFTAPWTLSNGGQVLFTMPRIAVIRGMILNHLYHHRGQLTVYLRLNDLPVPALYGPSADEGM